MSREQIARAVIFNQDDNLLMIERHKNGEHYFVLPGGHVDAGETSEQAVVREVAEETGLRVTVQKLLYTLHSDEYGNQQIFLCSYHGGEPQLQPDSIEYQIQQSGEPQVWLPAWFSLEQLKSKVVYPRGLIRYIDEDRALNYHHNPYKILERQGIIKR